MKIIFAGLMCLVLASSEALAISGGPVFTGAKTNIIGTYSGVLRGRFDPTNPIASNSIGVFSLGVPQSGTGTGAFTMFSRGRVFTGTINAVGDPQKGSVQGLVSASYNFTLSRTQLDKDGQPVIVNAPVTSILNGPLKAKVTSSNKIGAGISATRLNGDATIYVSGGFVSGSTGEPIINAILLLDVSGFKQSNTATTAAGL